MFNLKIAGCIHYFKKYATSSTLNTLYNIHRWKYCQNECYATSGCVAFRYSVRILFSKICGDILN